MRKVRKSGFCVKIIIGSVESGRAELWEDMQILVISGLPGGSSHMGKLAISNDIGTCLTTQSKVL
jgi:hypothetical protein